LTVSSILFYVRYGVLLLACIFLFQLVSSVGFSSFQETLRGLSWCWIAAALLFVLGNFLIVTLRYRILVATNSTFLEITYVTATSFLLNYASMVQGLGMGAKVGLLKAREVPAAHSIAGITLEVFLDVTCALVLVFVLYRAYILDLLDSISWFPAVIVFFGVPLLLVFIVKKYYLARWLSTYSKQLAVVFEFNRGLKVVFSTICIWLVAGSSLFCVLRSFDAAGAPTLSLALVAIAISFLVGSVSMVPGGIGVRELTMSYFLVENGVPVEVATSAAVIYRLAAIFVGFMLLAFLSFQKKSEKITFKQSKD